MIVKQIPCKDLDGKDVIETHRFHLSKAEIAEIELTQRLGLEAQLEEAVNSQDGETIIRLFKFVIGKSYGVRKDDYFDKSEEITRRFLLSDAYSELFVELVTNADKAAEFINGVMPADIAEKIRTTGLRQAQEGTTIQTETVELPQPALDGDVIVTNTPAPEYSDDAPAWFKEDRNPTPAEFAASSDAYKQIAFARRLSGQ